MKSLNRTMRLGCLAKHVARMPRSIGVLRSEVWRSERCEFEPSIVFERMARECIRSWVMVRAWR
jgi:hypothetical protein